MIGGRFPNQKGRQTDGISAERLSVVEHEKIPYQRRDTWWKESLKPTPIPGYYPVRDFLEEAQLNPVKATYNFKSEGRKRASIYEQRPDLTLSNTFMYYPPSFVELAEKRPATYSFKSTSRQSNYPVSGDKTINTDPGQYDLFPRPVPTFPTKSYMFRSAVQRHPIFPLKKKGKVAGTKAISTHVKPTETRSRPRDYEIKDVQPVPIRSSFISKVPRILPAHTKVPGPGYYWPTKQAPRQPRTIASLGREHTIFFSNVPEF